MYRINPLTNIIIIKINKNKNGLSYNKKNFIDQINSINSLIQTKESKEEEKKWFVRVFKTYVLVVSFAMDANCQSKHEWKIFILLLFQELQIVKWSCNLFSENGIFLHFLYAICWIYWFACKRTFYCIQLPFAREHFNFLYILPLTYIIIWPLKIT